MSEHSVTSIVSAPVCSPCFDFLPTPDGHNYEKRSVVIALIVKEELPDGVTTKLAYGCSRGPYCYDRECRYSNKRRLAEETGGIEHLATIGDR